MGRSLLTLGSFLLLATLGLWIADAAGWIPAAGDAAWTALIWKAGLAALAGGVLLRLFSPVHHRLAEGRCEMCSRPTERGHVYCLDHLRQTVDTYRDRERDGLLRRPGTRS